MTEPPEHHLDTAAATAIRRRATQSLKSQNLGLRDVSLMREQPLLALAFICVSVLELAIDANHHIAGSAVAQAPKGTPRYAVAMLKPPHGPFGVTGAACLKQDKRVGPSLGVGNSTYVWYFYGHANAPLLDFSSQEKENCEWVL